MPTVKPGEGQEDYIKRCIPVVLNEGTASDDKQAAAICYSLYSKRHNMSVVQQLQEDHARRRFEDRTGSCHCVELPQEPPDGVLDQTYEPGPVCQHGMHTPGCKLLALQKADCPGTPDVPVMPTGAAEDKQ